MHLFVDLIIEKEPGTIVLIERAVTPHGWALPGGHVDEGESPLAAAVREAREETGLEVRIFRLYDRYSFIDGEGELKGDTLVFVGRIVGGSPSPSTDAVAVREFSLAELPALIPAHRRILSDYRGLSVTPSRELIADS